MSGRAEGFVDVARLRPIARLGYMDYCVVDRLFSMARPEQPDPAAAAEDRPEHGADGEPRRTKVNA